MEAGVAASSKLRDDETADELQLGEDMPNQAAREAYHMSQLLHRAIMQVKDMPWPTLPEHITTEAAEAAIPTPLFNVLLWIMNGDASTQDADDISMEVPPSLAASPGVHRQMGV